MAAKEWRQRPMENVAVAQTSDPFGSHENEVRLLGRR